MEKWKKGIGRIVLTPEELSNLLQKARQEAIMETEAECQKSIKQMNDSWNDVLRDKIMEVIEASKSMTHEELTNKYL